MKTINIKGKEYVMVNERVKEFKEKYSHLSLETELVSLTETSCVIKAIVKDENGRIISTGHAQEDKDSSMINKTSYIENCETSAVGRALGFLGIGIDGSIASAEEVNIAIAKQINMEETNTSKGGDFKFASGKFKGKTIKEVDDEYPEYLDKLLEWDACPTNVRLNIEAYRKPDVEV